MDSGKRGMNPVIITIINPGKKYWSSQGLNEQPPALKTCMLPTELWASALMTLRKNALENWGKGENSGHKNGTWNHNYLGFNI